MSPPKSKQFGRWNSWFASLPDFRGKHLLIDVAAGILRWFGGNQQEVCLWKGAQFSVDLYDRIQRQMRFGCYEPHVMHAMRGILRNGDIFVDVGAHIGYHSYFAAGLVGPAGRVFAFEADPGNFARLKKNLERFPHAVAYHCAAWSREEKLSFERSASAGESGWGSLVRAPNARLGEQIEVQGVSLDGWSKRTGLKAIRAVKIDVEGAELAVLHGAETVLREMRPILLIELNAPMLRQSGASAAMIEQLLRKRGYELRALAEEPRQRWQAVANSESADYLATPQQRPEIDLLATRKDSESLS